MNDSLSDITKSVIETVGKDVYVDAIQPASKKLGETLLTIAKTVDTCALPLVAFNWGGEQLKSWLIENVAKRLTNVPDEQLVKPKAQVFVQSLNGLTICFESDELKEMFANLIAAACTAKTEEDAHPSFPSIIQQLTPYEASLLKYLFNKHPTGTIFTELMEEDDYYGNGDYIYSDILAGILRTSKPELCPGDNQVSSALDNFRRLQLITTRTESYSEYVEQLVDKYELIPPRVKNSFEVEIAFSGLGIQFSECCISKNL